MSSGCVISYETKQGVRWLYSIPLPPGPKGQRRRELRRGFRTKREAQIAKNKRLAEMDAGYVEPTKLTLGAYLEMWLSDAAKQRTAGKTFERYEQIIRVSITPSLGHVPLSKLTGLEIQRYYRKLQESGRLDGKAGGLSPTTVVQYHRILRCALQQAVKWKLIPQNPADDCDPPRIAKKEQKYLTADEARQLWEELAAAGSWMYLPVLMAIISGSRRGEVLGLKWSDLDLATGMVTVRRSLEQTREGLAWKLPKDGEGRTYFLPAFALPELRRHRGRQAQEKLLAGPAYQDQDLVFARPDGSPHEPDALSTQYHHWLKRRPHLKRVRFQDLRHTNATILLQAGENLKVVSERLGHSSVRITGDTYAHVMPGMQKGSAEKLDQQFGGSMRPGGLKAYENPGGSA